MLFVRILGSGHFVITLLLFSLVSIGTLSFSQITFAEQREVTINIPAGSSVPGCENTDECWIPYEVTIDVGDKVTWYNDDSVAHDVTSGLSNYVGGAGADGNFVSGLFNPGESFSVIFENFEPGGYPYFCTVHPWMEGYVIVEEDSQQVPIQLNVELDDINAVNGEMATFDISFFDSQGLPIQHVNYNIKASQDGNLILDDAGVHDHDGRNTHTTSELTSAERIDVEVELLGLGLDEPFTGPIGENFELTIQTIEIPSPTNIPPTPDPTVTPPPSEDVITPAESVMIPNWIKDNAGWWANDAISEADFVNAIQFLIKEKIIVIPGLAESGEDTGQAVPEWVKNNAGWWATGAISDNEFVSAIQFLVEKGIIRV